MIKNFLIIITQLTFTLSLFCQNSIDSSSSDTISRGKYTDLKSITAIDTQLVPASDSIFVIVKNINQIPKKTFWEENLSTFLGSFLAAIVALFSIWATNRVNKKNEEEKQLEKKRIDDLHYSSLLGLISSIARNHEKSSQILEQEIEFYKKKFIESGQLSGDSPFRKLETSLIKEYLLQIIKFVDYDIDIAAKVTAYIDIIEILDRELNLKELKQWEFEDEDDYEAKIEGYFNNILIRYNSLRLFRQEIITSINTELIKRRESSEMKEE